MAQRGIREYDAKLLLAKNLPNYLGKGLTYSNNAVLVDPKHTLEQLKKSNPWLTKEKLVVKPDHLFGKRGKLSLILLNASYNQVRNYLKENTGKEITIKKARDELTHFIVEPFVPHEDEYYIAIRSERSGEHILFSAKGGVDIEENKENVISIHIPIEKDIEKYDLSKELPSDISQEKNIERFIKALYNFKRDFGFSYIEMNPFTIVNNSIIALDVVAKVDDTARYQCKQKWGSLEFPVPFGRKFTPEEKYIKELDKASGSSLKLTVLNPEGVVWTMIAGGGASIIYSDTIVDLGFGNELANYGEYSGNPTTDETWAYAKTILDLMTRKKDPKGRPKILIIGGGIANFTDVAKTFKGIIKAIREYANKLKRVNAKIYVRRGGPNYEEGLKLMQELGVKLDLPIEVYGPETHMTKIVSMALKNLK